MESITESIMENKNIKAKNKPFYRFVKRVFDIVSSLLGLIILSPLFLIISIAIYIDDPGPVLFFQDRDGLNNKVFKMWKFRSMYKNAHELRFELDDQNEFDGPAFKIMDDPRVTKVGKFLRRSSMDELPQLVNILRGDMSVVGPRPIATYETANMTDEQRQRTIVKPGLICYWQVSGRSNLSFDEWMEMDFQYIEDEGLWTDIKIIFKAIPAVLSGLGAA